MADRALFRRYLAELTSVAAQGDAREGSGGGHGRGSGLHFWYVG
jgi:hypothetical protein